MQITDCCLRDNIDPKGLRDDAHLNALLKVIRDSVGPGSTLQRKFTLDAEVTAEGANFSAGERQLCELDVLLASIKLIVQCRLSGHWLDNARSSFLMKPHPQLTWRPTP